MMKYTPHDIEALTNWDNLLCKPPWRNKEEKQQYYSRYVNRMLWRFFSDKDWNELASLTDHLRISDKIKKTTQFLVQKHKQVAEDRCDSSERT